MPTPEVIVAVVVSLVLGATGVILLALQDRIAAKWLGRLGAGLLIAAIWPVIGAWFSSNDMQIGLGIMAVVCGVSVWLSGYLSVMGFISGARRDAQE